MHIVVCMKQVPRDNSVKINPDLSINAEGIEQIMNLFDEYAVEEALRGTKSWAAKSPSFRSAPRPGRSRSAARWPWAPPMRCC